MKNIRKLGKKMCERCKNKNFDMSENEIELFQEEIYENDEGEYYRTKNLSKSEFIEELFGNFSLSKKDRNKGKYFLNQIIYDLQYCIIMFNGYVITENDINEYIYSNTK